MDRFSQILFDLGREMQQNLYPDHNRICQLNYLNKLRVQLSYDEYKELLTIATFVCDVPPGKYRENLFKEALKVNDAFPRLGSFAYSERNNQLVLFEQLYAPPLKGAKLHQEVQQFIEKALEWKTAVERGGALPSR